MENRCFFFSCLMAWGGGNSCSLPLLFFHVHILETFFLFYMVISIPWRGSGIYISSILFLLLFSLLFKVELACGSCTEVGEFTTVR